MNRNMLAMTALGLGAAFLMRNKETREKLKDQVNDFTQNSDGKGTRPAWSEESDHYPNAR